MTEVQLRLALGTSNDPEPGGLFQLIVQNVASEKRVSIWAESRGHWGEIPACFIESLPGNLELWRATGGDHEGEFVAKLEAGGHTFWDDNHGKNYRLPQARGELSVLTGSSHPVVLADAAFTSAGLRVNIVVTHDDDAKAVGILYTVDNWATQQVVSGRHACTTRSGAEIWQVDEFVSPAHDVRLAVFCRAAGTEHWDNNFGRDYSLGLFSERSKMTAGALCGAFGRTWNPPQPPPFLASAGMWSEHAPRQSGRSA
jgi:hypothetical protein